MKQMLCSAAVTLAAALTLCGCGNTLQGAKEDTAKNAAKTQQAVDQAGKAVADVPQNAEANALRVPVKTAILRDPVLTADKGNLIDVNGVDHRITLTGHVTSEAMKSRAGEDAQVALGKHPGYTLSNELIVGAATPPVQP